MTTPTSRSAQSCRQLSIEIELLICHSLSLPQQRHTEEVLHKTGAASQSERGGSKANGGMSHTLMFFFYGQTRLSLGSFTNRGLLLLMLWLCCQVVMGGKTRRTWTSTMHGFGGAGRRWLTRHRELFGHCLPLSKWVLIFNYSVSKAGTWYELYGLLVTGSLQRAGGLVGWYMRLFYTYNRI